MWVKEKMLPWEPAFSPFLAVFSKAFFFMVVKSWDCVVKSLSEIIPFVCFALEETMHANVRQTTTYGFSKQRHFQQVDIDFKTVTDEEIDHHEQFLLFTYILSKNENLTLRIFATKFSV